MSQLAFDLRVSPDRTECCPQRRDRLGVHSLLQVPPGGIALRLRERGIELEGLAKLRDGLIVLARVEIVPAEVSAHHQLERFQLERALAFGQGIGGPPERKQTV